MRRTTFVLSIIGTVVCGSAYAAGGQGGNPDKPDCPPASPVACQQPGNNPGPGPVAGAGFSFLLAGGAYLVVRRRRNSPF